MTTKGCHKHTGYTATPSDPLAAPPKWRVSARAGNIEAFGFGSSKALTLHDLFHPKKPGKTAIVDLVCGVLTTVGVLSRHG